MKNDINSRRNKRYRRSQKISRGKSFNKIFFYILIIAFGFLVYNFGFSKDEKEVVTEKASVVIEEAKKPVVVIPEKDYRAEVDNVIASYPGTDISVTYINLSKPSTINTYGSTETFLGASTTKLISAVCLLREVEAGEYGLKSPLGSSTVEWHLRQMINQSNNVSWDLIIKRVGYANLGYCSKQLGLTTFSTYNNSVATLDIAILLRDLYRGKLLNESNTAILLSHMKATNNENLIAAAVPNGFDFWHKYGDYSGHLHDAAIIKDGQDEYVLVIYTNRDSGTNYEVQTDIIHKITKIFTTQ